MTPHFYLRFHYVTTILSFCVKTTEKILSDFVKSRKTENHWSCIAHLSAEDMLKSAVIGEKKFKHSPRAGADNPLGPKV